MAGSDQRRKTVTIRDIAGSVSFENVILEIKDKTGQKAARVSIQSGTAAKLLSEEILSARITRLSGVKDMSGAVIIGAETGGEGKT